MSAAQFQRLAERDRRTLSLTIDGQLVSALEGDTLMTAILTNAGRLCVNEFDRRPRAGFCLMGACQDCWVALESGGSVRACSTPAADGMRIVTFREGDGG